MQLEVHTSIAEIDAVQWNAMLESNNPFMRHEFLLGLEATGCVSPDAGWQPSHLAVYQDTSQTRLLGAMPLYVKSHSYGEYIFDWAWADAFHRNGLHYYPKLSNAVPFTPATGERFLTASGSNPVEIADTMIKHALSLAEAAQMSSFHCLFCDPSQLDSYKNQRLLARHSTQFHWQNRDYTSFDHFLDQLSSKKRKNIRRERRRVSEAGIQYRWVTQADLTPRAADQMFDFYLRTVHCYGAQSYLNRDFFHYLVDNFSHQTLILLAQHEDQVVAGGLYFKSDDTLFGRYWGTTHDLHSVHFETCYYQAIDWCIQHGYARFEAGAQGEHKLARGLEPVTTYSAHWLRDPRFYDAVDEFLNEEQHHIQEYQTMLSQHSPFKATRK
ncbi:hypothetical protein GCM10008090_28670 [Arenicella chitinivorans]|uniref:N-acetyltransferase n=1 Tax=Arenicella chitinivorans TaxID=1329800 RepID=A0A918VQS6_9GAMM|nr:GNAT family N-acetyltransferase [Arenicella chitinivorans]GHA17244.1 hypothetical protein GCM10008090_28670 [Arenicella chitinivorans]